MIKCEFKLSLKIEMTRKLILTTNLTMLSLYNSQVNQRTIPDLGDNHSWINYDRMDMMSLLLTEVFDSLLQKRGFNSESYYQTPNADL